MHAIYVISIILISIGITLFLLSFIFEYTRKQNLKKSEGNGELCMTFCKLRLKSK